LKIVEYWSRLFDKLYNVRCAVLKGRNSFTIVHVQIILHCIIVCDLSSYDLYRRSPMNNPVAETAQVRRLLTFPSCINVVCGSYDVLRR